MMLSMATMLMLVISFSLHSEEPVKTFENEKAFLDYHSALTEHNRVKLLELSFYVQKNESFEKMRGRESVTSLSNDERQLLREAWAQLLNYHLQLNLVINAIREKIKENEDNVFLSDDYFIIQYAAYLAQYRSAIDFIRAMRTIPTTDKVLNEPIKELQLEERTFAAFKFEYLNIEKFLEYSGYRVQAIDKRLEISNLNAGIENDNDLISKFNRYKGALYTLKNAGKIAKHILFKMYFPLQKNISEWMGDERIARGDEFLIKPDQIKIVHSMLKPGDILIERREWYLSNIGLPGFWPHAALYLGRPEERSELEEDEAVQMWVKENGIISGSFEALLENKYPQVYKDSLGKDEAHYDYRVLEAMSEGVVFTSLEHSANADSLAVIRPRLSKLDIAKSLLTSLKYQGRPYDFNFDFRTDSEVVCSELIYYSFQPTKDKNGITFPVSETLGRPVVTPNNIIKELAETFETDKQQYDFVLFLDGNDKKREAVFSTIEELKTSWNRPKWFIFTQNKKKK